MQGAPYFKRIQIKYDEPTGDRANFERYMKQKYHSRLDRDGGVYIPFNQLRWEDWQAACASKEKNSDLGNFIERVGTS